MRTTLTLDPDVAQQLRASMARRQASLKEVVNEALRRGLAAAAPSSRKPFRVTPHHFGFKPGIDMTKLNQLSDELEAQAYTAKLRPSKPRR
jgi:hypothetical protein